MGRSRDLSRLLGTSSLRLPVGPTTDRPGSPDGSEIRKNSTTGDPE